MRLYEVRCCCRPEKLLGYLPGDDGLQPYQTHLFMIPPRIVIDGPRTGVVVVKCDVLKLRLSIYAEGNFGGERHESLAFKAEDVPLERLRQIPGFLEPAR